MTPPAVRGRVLAGFALLTWASFACNPATPASSGTGGKGGSAGTHASSGGSGGGQSAGATGGSGNGGVSGGSGDQAGSGGGSGGSTGSGTGGSTAGGGGSGGAGAGGSASDAAVTEDAPAADGPAAAADGAPTSGAGCAGAKVCDDFEGYAAGAAPGGVWKPGNLLLGTLAVDDTRAHSGKHAVLVKGNGGGETELLLEVGAPVLPFPNNNIYGRAMIFIPKVPTTKAGHWDLIRATGTLPGVTDEVQYTIGTRDGHFLLDYEPHDCVHDSKQAFPENRWACISWQFDGSKGPDGKPKDEMHVWLDGTEIQDAAVVHSGDACTYGGKTTEWEAPTFDKFHIGWNQYHPAVPFEMWIDDVALDDKPISCPP